MNKKIIAIAIATVMAAPVAMADVKVSGQMFGDYTDVDDGNSFNMGDTKTSARLIFDGTSGDAFARISYKEGFNKNLGDTKRQKYAGYKFNGYNIRGGAVNSATYALEGDKLKGTFVQMSTGFVADNAGVEEGIIQYNGKVAGMAVKVDYNPNQNDAVQDYMAASVKGKMGSVGVFASYSSGATTSMKVGASMKFGATNVTAAYMTEDDTDTSGVTLMADMGLGNGQTILVGYAQVDSDNTQARVAYVKELSKGVKVIAGYNSAEAAGVTSTTTGLAYMVNF